MSAQRPRAPSRGTAAAPPPAPAHRLRPSLLLSSASRTFVAVAAG